MPYFDEFHRTYRVKIALLHGNRMTIFFTNCYDVTVEAQEDGYMLDVAEFDPIASWKEIDEDDPDAADQQLTYDFVNDVMREARILDLDYVWWKLD